MSFVAWRAIHSRLPTYEKKLRFRITLTNDCSCCIGAGMTPRSESSKNLFCTGQYAQRILQSFVGDMGDFRRIDLRELMYKI